MFCQNYKCTIIQIRHTAENVEQITSKNKIKFLSFSKDARLPEQLQRAMAAEAEASREARAKVIAADGEKRASRALREASNVIDESPSALQLRYLQVLHDKDLTRHLQVNNNDFD